MIFRSSLYYKLLIQSHPHRTFSNLNDLSHSSGFHEVVVYDKLLSRAHIFSFHRNILSSLSFLEGSLICILCSAMKEKPPKMS